MDKSRLHKRDAPISLHLLEMISCPSWWDSAESVLAAPSDDISISMSWANKPDQMAVIDFEDTKGNFAVKFSQCT